MARITLNTKVSIDLEEVFSTLRDTYTPEQLARIAVRMGTTKLNEYGFASQILTEAAKVMMRRFKDEPEEADYDHEFYNAVKHLSGREC